MREAVDRLYVTLTHQCNMTCPHCWVGATPGDDGTEIATDEILGAIEELRKQGLRRVKLTGGEPLIRREVVFPVLRHCKEHHIGVSLETNASLIDDEYLDLFASIDDLEIGISLDYPSPDLFDSFRGLPGAFEKVVHAFKRLNHLQRRPGGVMVVFADNFEMMPTMARLIVEELGGSIKFNLCTDMGRAQSLGADAVLPVQRIPDYFDMIHKLAAKYPGRVTTILPMAFYRPSSPLKVGVCEPDRLLALLPNGDVCLCGIGITNPNAIFGNIRNTTLREILEHSEELHFVQNIRQAKPEGVCGRCIFESCCGHICPAWSLEIYGTYSGSFPLCQRLYEAGMFPAEFLTEPDRGDGGC